MKIQVKPTANMKIHQKIVPTVLLPARYSIMFTDCPFTLTFVTPAIAENISISPSISCNSHRNSCRQSS